MPNITSVLNEQIRRLARREIKSQSRIVRRLTAQHRRDIAAMKREIADLQKRVAFLERQEKRRVGTQPSTPDKLEGIRFRADGLRSHRQRLGVSAEDYGKLVGASGLSVYHWESGKVRPRRQQVARLAGVRGLGKREAMKRLSLLNGKRG
jgi:DNA-binding transcriptional regulator YiaG